MPSKITSFISGACFGYYDMEQKSCKKCKYSKSCEKATKSKEVFEVRKIFKTRTTIIEQLNEKYK